MLHKEWLIAVIITFITISAWVIFDIFHTRSQVEIPQQLQEIIVPISPDLNTSSIELP